MARGDQLARQWMLIQILSSSRNGCTAAELADGLGCSYRTVYRDLTALQIAGFPIYVERIDGQHLWSLLDAVQHHVPIPFSLSELMALYFTRDLCEVFRGTVFHDSLESLFQKIRTTLPKESTDFVETVEQVLTIGIKPYKQYGGLKEIINRVNEAAVKKKSVEIVYYTMSRAKTTTRRVDPYRLWFFNGTFYLIGYCHARGEIRIFALDRIKMLHVTSDDFRMLQGFTLEEFLKSSFGVVRGEAVYISVQFDSTVAGYITEKVWHESQTVTMQDDGAVIVAMEVAPGAELRSWIMSWGSHAQVLEPASLREEFAAEIAAMRELYAQERRLGTPSRSE